MQLYEISPVLRIFPLPFWKAFHYFETIKKHIIKVVDEHRKSHVTGEPRDLIDCYLKEMEKVRYSQVFVCVMYFYCIYQQHISFKIPWFKMVCEYIILFSESRSTHNIWWLTIGHFAVWPVYGWNWYNL